MATIKREVHRHPCNADMLCIALIACNTRIEVSSFQLFRSPHKIIMMLCIQNKKSNHFILLYHHFFASSNTFSLQFTFNSITSQALFGITVSWADLNQQNQGNDVQLPATRSQSKSNRTSLQVDFNCGWKWLFFSMPGLRLSSLVTSESDGSPINGILLHILKGMTTCLCLSPSFTSEWDKSIPTSPSQRKKS